MFAKQINRVVVLGASRGLGRTLVELLDGDNSVENVLAISRSPLANAQNLSAKVQWVSSDLSKAETRAKLWTEIENFRPQAVVYCAGGGPYAPYGEKKWRDHRWALEVSFIAVAELLHVVLNFKSGSVHTFVVIGSSVAESHPDPKAASYSAAKHGLVGLLSSVRSENPQLNIKLYSPGYMDTPMIPPGAELRQRRLWSTKDVIDDLWPWIKSRSNDEFHRRLALFPPQG